MLILFIFIIQASCKNYNIVNTVYPGDKLMWDHINRSEPAIELDDIPGGAILPHHTITANTVARFYKGLSKKINPKVVFLLSPNHYETGGHSVITGINLTFDTVYGNLETENNIIRDLVTKKYAYIDNKTFQNEHGIYFHAPFIKKYFPNAKVVPILLEWQNSQDENDKIADFISNNSNEETFIIASVDFSHYQPKAVADFHDETSFYAIKNFHFDKLYDLEVDSPSSLYTILKVMQNSKYLKAKRYFHTNSDDFLNKNEKKTTSHQYFTFFKGGVDRSSAVSILITGNIAVDNSRLYTRVKWGWDRKYKPEDDITITRYLAHLRGIEDRFFMGSDIYLFDLKEYNKPKIFTVNDKKVAVIKFNELTLDHSSQIRLLHDIKEAGSYVILLYEYEKINQDKDYQKKFRGFIDAGAAVVVGKGKSNIKKEIYRGKPIFYSLGDFITSKIDSKGELVGLILQENNIHFYTFPVIIKNGYPEYDGVFDSPSL